MVGASIDDTAGGTDTRVKIAVVGAGDMGRRHMQAIVGDVNLTLAAIVDPWDNGKAAAEQFRVPLFADLAVMIDSIQPDGAIIATPNDLHASLAQIGVARRLPILIEKPIADKVSDAYALAELAEAAGVPILVGHHRRHNPLIQEARRIIESGALGVLTAVSATWLVRKPDDYFNVRWRREQGGGPILINLIHDIDNLRYLAGEIVAVQATSSNRRRDYDVEDTAAIVVTFAGGALGTILISDAAPSPWSWELTAGETTSYAYPRTSADCYVLAGSLAALGVPSLRVWRHDGAQSWRSPLLEECRPVAEADPFALQLRHFAAVIRGAAAPMVTARDAARTLEVTLAVKDAARTKTIVELPVRERP